MHRFVRCDVRRRVAVLTIDHPPVNALAEGVREEILQQVARASQDPSIDAVVLTGAGATGNTVAGNYIGTTPGANIAVGNASAGILLAGGAAGNQIGAFASTPGAQTRSSQGSSNS